MKLADSTDPYGLPSTIISTPRDALRLWLPPNHQSTQFTLPSTLEGLPSDRHMMLVLHGLSSRSSWMTPYVKQLMHRRPDILYLGVDMPEIGGLLPEGRHHSRLTHQTIASVADILASLDRHLTSGRLYVTGFSMGAPIAIHALSRLETKEHLAGLILLAPAFAFSRHLALNYVGIIKRMPFVAYTDQDEWQRAGLEAELAIKDRLVRRFENWNLFTRVIPMMGTAPLILQKELKDLPIRAFASHSDYVVSTQRILKSLPPDTLTLYPHKPHDLIRDGIIQDIATRITNWIETI